jgi:predicted nucleic acid-binding protein
MVIDRNTTLFFDASVLVAGSLSSRGGSALLLAACRAGGLRAQMSGIIALESMRALENSSVEDIERCHSWLVEIQWEVLPVPPEELLHKYERYIDPKDAHVLAAAVEGGSQFLLTLDRRHVLAAAPAAREAGLALTILTPGEFIRQYYPQHQDYYQLPPNHHR